MKKIYSLLLIIILSIPCYSQALIKSEIVDLDGTETYYEVYGNGEPLFFLHGWASSSQSWHQYISGFTDNFEVYLVDLKGHGKSSLLKEEFSLQTAVDNFLALLDYLQLKEISAVGFSFGGEVLLQVCKSSPERIKSMVIIGSEYKWSGKDLEVKYDDLSPKRLENLKNHHAHGEPQIRALYEQIKNLEIDLAKEQLEKINTATLLIYGDKDKWVPDLHRMVDLNNYLPNSYLWIVPNKGHNAFNHSSKPEFIRIANEFLNGKW